MRHADHCGRGEVPIGFWWGISRERVYLEDLYLDGWIILKWIIRRWTWLELIWLMVGQVAEFFEYGNEGLGFIKCGEFLTSGEPVAFSGITLLHGVRRLNSYSASS